MPIPGIGAITGGAGGITGGAATSGPATSGGINFAPVNVGGLFGSGASSSPLGVASGTGIIVPVLIVAAVLAGVFLFRRK